MDDGLALERAPCILAGARSQPVGRGVSCGVAEPMLDKFTWDDEVAPILANAAQNDVGVRVVRVFPLTPLSIAGFVGRDVGIDRI
jgi:hypothetical protein